MSLGKMSLDSVQCSECKQLSDENKNHRVKQNDTNKLN